MISYLTNTSKTKRREGANNVSIVQKNAVNFVLGLNVRIKIKFKEGCKTIFTKICFIPY
jgi:hypothetical protein